MRAPVAVLVLGTALAVGLPVAWAVTRPDAAAGPPVAAVLSPPSTSPTPAAPSVGVRPAGVPPVVTVVPPVRLEVPDLGIDAPLDPVGVQPDGAMALPSDVDRVGWYRFGPAPGADQGAAVLAGHVDDRTQGLGALAPLRSAAVGTQVQVTDAAGTSTRWRIAAREAIEKPAVPLAELFRRDGPPRLVLITCGGEFDPALRSYRDNVVVVADPVP